MTQFVVYTNRRVTSSTVMISLKALKKPVDRDCICPQILSNSANTSASLRWTRLQHFSLQSSINEISETVIE